MTKKKEITIRSSAAEYLTFISAVGDQPESVELRYQDENIWLTQRLLAVDQSLVDAGKMFFSRDVSAIMEFLESAKHGEASLAKSKAVEAEIFAMVDEFVFGKASSVDGCTDYLKPIVNTRARVPGL